VGYFLAQQLDCSVHVFGCKNAPFVPFEPGDREGAAGGQPCHAERCEASLCPARQTLRGVYPERSEWAQGDSEEADFVSFPRFCQKTA
jgi:hypothetical protein